MKIYVASSWRNYVQPTVVECLRDWGHEVYDFKNPWEKNAGFGWEQIDPDWANWDVEEYRQVLDQPLAEQGFESDMSGLRWADCTVLVLPCGRSAHTEAGWHAGQGKPVYVFSSEAYEPELMYKLFDGICGNLAELKTALSSP